MFALFKCCEQRFWGRSTTIHGERAGPGFVQAVPLQIRVVCPVCTRPAEIVLPTGFVMAGCSQANQAGLARITVPHLDALAPLCVVAGRQVRRSDTPEEEFGFGGMATDWAMALAAASRDATLQPGELSPRTTSTILMHNQPQALRMQIQRSLYHTELHNGHVDEPAANAPIVTMRMRQLAGP